MIRYKVSIVIPFYNDPYIGEAIASAAAQTYSSAEIVVVDDGSLAGLDALSPWLPRIRYVRRPNGGTAAALNEGIRAATGDYIAWLSSDDRLLPDKLDRQLAFMLERDAWISFTNFNIIGAEGQYLHRKVTPPFRSPEEVARFFLLGNPVNGCTVMWRKGLTDRIGLFDESLLYTHDLDMWLRAVITGYPLHFLNEPLTDYRHHDAMGSVRHRRAAELEAAATMARHRARLLWHLRGSGEAAGEA